MVKINTKDLASALNDAFDEKQLSNHKTVYYNIFNGKAYAISKKDKAWHKFWLQKVSFKYLLEKENDVVDGTMQKEKMRAIYNYIIIKNETLPTTYFSRLIFKIRGVEKAILKRRKLINKNEDILEKCFTKKIVAQKALEKLPASGINLALAYDFQNNLPWINNFKGSKEVQKVNWKEAQIGSYYLEENNGLKMVVKGPNMDLTCEIRKSEVGLNLYDYLTELDIGYVVSVFPKTLSNLATYWLLFNQIEDKENILRSSPDIAILFSHGIFNIAGKLHMIDSNGGLTKDMSLIHSKMSEIHRNLKNKLNQIIKEA